MTIYSTRCQIKDMAANIWDQLESEGWERVMSSTADGVMKKTLPTGDFFLRITPVISNTNFFYIGPVEDYIPGTTGVDLTTTRTKVGLSPGVESFSFQVTGLPSTDGNLILTLNDAPVNVPVYSGTVDVVARRIKEVLAADLQIATDYEITQVNDTVTITKKEAGVVPLSLSLTDTTTGVVGNSSRKTAGVDSVYEKYSIAVTHGATTSGTLAVTFNDGTINKVINVPVLTGDTPEGVANKLYNSLTADGSIMAVYTIDYQGGAVINLESKTDGPITVNLSISDIATGGVAASFVETQAGVTAISEWFDLVVTGRPIADGTVSLGLNNVPVPISVSSGDLQASNVAAKIRTALASDPDVSLDYDVTGANDEIIITKKLEGDIPLTVVVAANSTGVTSALTGTTDGGVGISESSTIKVTNGCVTSGTLGVFINDGMINKTINVPVVSADTTAQVAQKIQAVVDAMADYTASANSNTVTIKAVTAQSQIDASFSGGSTGASAAISVTQQGVTGVKEINTITVTAGPTATCTVGVVINDGIINKTVNVPVNAGDTQTIVASKIASALELDSIVGAAYTITNPIGATDTVALEREAAGAVATSLSVNNIFSGVNTSISNTVDGVAGVKEVTTLKITEGCETTGGININFDDSNIMKQVSVSLNGADTINKIAGRIQTTIEALPDFDATITEDTITISATSAADLADPTFDPNSTDVTGIITMLGQGGAGSKEENQINVLNGAAATGFVQLRFKNATIDKLINVNVVSGNVQTVVAANIKNALAADAEIMASYDVDIAGAIVIITRKVVGPSNTTIKKTYFSNINGTFANDQAKSIYYAGAGLVMTSPFNYRLYSFEDHIILVIIAETAIANSINSITYVGRLRLWSPEPNNLCHCMVSTNQREGVNTYPLKDKNFLLNGPAYSAYTAVPPSNPGAGGLYYMAPIEIGSATDGIRGELQHIYLIPLSNVVQDDTITVGTQVYDVCTAGSTGSSGFDGTRAVAIYNRG